MMPVSSWNFGPGATPLERAIMNAVRHHHVASRAQIAESLHLSRSRVSPEIKGLLDRGMLAARGLASSNGGRRWERLSMPGPEAGLVVGIDIDVHEYSIGVTDLSSAVLSATRFEAEVDRGPAPCLEEIAERVAEALREYEGSPLLAIGVGVPAPVDFATGMTILPPIMPGWNRYPIRDYLIDRFDVPAYVDNDVNVLALGEMHGRLAAGQATLAEETAFLCVKVSTGIGCGTVLQGGIYRGEQGSAGDIGHICVDPHSAVVCSCGRPGCLEALAAAPPLLRRARDIAERGDSPVLSDLMADAEELTPAALGRAAVMADQGAMELIRESGQRIGYVLAGLVSFFNPTEIVLNTVFTDATDLLLSEIRQEIYRRSLPLATRDLAVSSSLVPTAGVVGASAMAVEGMLGEVDDSLVAQASQRLQAALA